MKIVNNILVFAVVAFAVAACTTEPDILDFKTDVDTIEVEATGGVEKVKIESSEEWIALVSQNTPWIAVSPANGRGSVTCDFVVDSALTAYPREAKVVIRNIATNKEQRITVKQKGFDYTLEVDRAEVEVAKFAEYGTRYFDVVVKANFPFEAKVPQESQYWISREPAAQLGEAYQLNLDRGVRPREVKVRFNWSVNNRPEIRVADIEFAPVADTITMAHSDVLRVSQEAAEPITPDTRAGDSLALLNIVNMMRCEDVCDTKVSMDKWAGITLWKEGMEGCTPEKVGRVKRVALSFSNTYEELPYEFQYLTAAEEIYIFSNSNTMLKSINMGKHICELTNLKRLTVGAFGLTELPDEFANFKNLEYLDLGSNNFQRVPSILTKENLPKLRTLVLNAQQRYGVLDLSNTRHTKEELGGLIDEEQFPGELLKWGLDTLILSVNYLHGALPSFEEDPEVPKWTEAEVIAADTLPMALVGTPKVMPTTKSFRINHNRLSGELPVWLLMHPMLDWWMPFNLIFPQEGRCLDGSNPHFTNAPTSLSDYYKNWYPNKKLANSVQEEITEEEIGGTITKKGVWR